MPTFKLNLDMNVLPNYTVIVKTYCVPDKYCEVIDTTFFYPCVIVPTKTWLH
jgi:hypothetical protein